MTCGQRMRSEFRLKSFGLTHNDRHLFTRTPWLKNQLPFVLYRVAACLYQVVIFFAVQGATGLLRPLLLVFLTQWAFIILTLHTIVSAALCFADYYNSRSQRGASDDNRLSSNVVMETGSTIELTTTGSRRAETNVSQQSAQTPPLPWYYKICWVLYNVAFSGGIIVTILFWALFGRYVGINVGDILFHAVNSVTIVIDVMVSGLPCRLLHFVYPSIFGGVYIIFTAIYWASGGRGLYDYPFIYPVLDYGGNPALAAIVAVLGVLVAVPVCHCIVFALVVARESLVHLLQRRNLSNSHGDDIATL
ncbi:protein rolling stone-like [Branchiostoma lanceolatum]|uniref:protein rolling stone-like n=1 Tax=Branchiostoma lanceolatum TaxID=7740 RepID=UPI003452819E